MAKRLLVAMAIFCMGCATAPTFPSFSQTYDDIKAGRLTADGVNKRYDDYYAARKEYEQSASYKLTIAALFPLLLLGGAANGLPCGYRGSGYRGYQGYQGCGGKAVINTVPTTGGGSVSTINYYR